MMCPHCGGAIQLRISAQQRKDVLKLAAQGFSSRDIQQKLGVSFSSAARIVREARKK